MAKSERKSPVKKSKRKIEIEEIEDVDDAPKKKRKKENGVEKKKKKRRLAEEHEDINATPAQIDEKEKKKKKKSKEVEAAKAISVNLVDEIKECVGDSKSSTIKSTSTDIVTGFHGKTEAEENASDLDTKGTKKVFCNNLPWSIDESAIFEYFGKSKSIDWIEDRETGRFKGMAVIEFNTVTEAEAAVAKSGGDLGGRTVYCRLDVKKSASPRAMKPKPDGCRKLFCGNLSYHIDDDAIKDFFSTAGIISSVKWVTDRDSGDFKGCGFIEFESTDMVDKAITLQGSSLLGRPIKLDW